MEIQEIAAQLETIYEQIKKYPTPIAGCDEQFNFLLEERDRLRNLLATVQIYSTVTDLARLRGLSTSVPLIKAA